MLVSHRYKFIYTKTFKTASTSIESYFERFCMHDGEWAPQHARDVYESDAGIIGFRGRNRDKSLQWYSHMPATQIKQLIGDDIWNSYYKFCSIRNPWDKSISAYFHFGENFRLSPYRKLTQKLVHPNLSPKQHHFLGWLRKKQPPTDRDKYQIDDQPCMDHYIHYENLHHDMRSICGTLGIPWNEALLPQFKAGKRDKAVTLDELYSPPAHKEIERHYAYEIQHFNYTYSP